MTEQCEPISIEAAIATYTWPDGPKSHEGQSLKIVIDGRSIGDIRESICTRIQRLRADRALSQGQTSARLFVAIVVDYIFGAAAGVEPARVSARELIDMLRMPDHQIAHVAGGFDWGLPITGIPNYAATVFRLSLLDEIIEHMTTDPARAPRRVVLSGHTGIGKSVLASDYCHVERGAYEFICWINCRELSLIEPQLRDIVSQLTKEFLSPHSDIGPHFTGVLGRQRGPWLLVFDGVRNRADIERYMPTQGNGGILLTSTNSLGWWPDAYHKEVEGFSEDEAIDCFASYAGIDAAALDDSRQVIAGIVGRLGLIPLAVSMAGLYFQNTEGNLHELANGYFDGLESLDDSYAVPPGFDKTAYAAVRHAVDHLGVGTKQGERYRRDAQAVLYMGSLLAPELLPLNLLLPASAKSFNLDLAQLPEPSEADATLRRAVVSTLRTQTIAHRVVNAEFGGVTLASETLAVHPLVHEILQHSYIESLPPGQLEMAATVLMAFLTGWLGTMRTSGQFFATEQLRVHAEALHDLVRRHEPLASYSVRQRRVHAYAKALMLAEMGTCQASRGNLQSAVELNIEAAQTLSSYQHETAARRIAMKLVADILTDLSFADAPSQLLAERARGLVPALTEAENDRHKSIRDLAYTLAGEAALMLRRVEAYRECSELQKIATQLDEIGFRDPTPSKRPHTVSLRLNALYEAGEFAEILGVLPEFRATARLIYEVTLLDAAEIVALLHINRTEQALMCLDRFLGIDPYGNHLTIVIRDGLTKIAKSLHMLQTEKNGSGADLLNALERVLARYERLAGTTLRAT